MALVSFTTVWSDLADGKLDLGKEHVCALPPYTLYKPIRVVNIVRTETVLDNAVTATSRPDVCPPDAKDVTTP